MMKYQETVNQSAEYLRLSLPLMSRQAAALHPISYAVWYEYVAGINKPLQAAIDTLTKNGAQLDETITADLFQKYIAELDAQTAQRLADGFQKALNDIAQSAAHAEDHADQFGNELVQCSEDLGNVESDSGTIKVIDKLLFGIHEMQGAITTLKGRLDDSQSEIEKLRQEVDRAREEALADGLTGLVNRRGFDLALAACLSTVESGEQGPSLLIADIDHFKQVNDNYGHLFGDKVLCSVAKILQANIKGKDTAARYGGEEFVVLLPETTIEGAHALAEKIRSTIERSRIRRANNGQEIAQITISLGVASYCFGETAGAFVERVDNALYVSKNQGRNRVTLAPAGPQRKPAKAATEDLMPERGSVETVQPL
ncbi:diguanylate cyclase [Propionivibrio sp.]|uniref:diguanylate cyclase n=1 Tax=Propionivibrio sp. TaxID=2212460 RepID=UPI00262531DC|nr:diguanylate cyclase [Propionivibrio sp.]